MTLTITQELKFFLGHSLEQMEHLKQQGIVSDRLFGHYTFFWLWGEVREDYRHFRFYKKMGSDAYWRRIERVKNLIEKINNVPVPSPEHVPFRLGSLNH